MHRRSTLTLLLCSTYLLAVPLLATGCNLPDPSDFEQSEPEPSEPAPDIVDPPVAIGFAVTSVEPSAGEPRGLELIEIRGGGFKKGARVFFGGSESTDVTVTSEGLIYAVNPPHSPGRVPVRVINADTTVAEKQDGFFYFETVEVESIEPARGPITGGVPIEITGRGFTDASAVLIEGREALDVRVLDDYTVLAILPAGVSGSADVLVVSPGGVGRLRNGFDYFAQPRVTGLAPLAAPTTGGGTLALAGEGLVESSQVAIGDTPAEVLATTPDGSRIVVRVPPGAAGAADVTVTTPNGQVVLPGAFTYVTGDGAFRLLNVWPPSGPAAGGGEIILVASGLHADAEVEVEVGGRAVPVQAVLPGQYQVLITAPAGVAGEVVDVTLTVDGASDTLLGAYEYVRTLEVGAVQPPEGSTTGGERLTVFGQGFDGDEVEVFIGALPATSVEVIDDQTLEVTAPMGSAGYADVRVRVDGQQARLADGYTFVAGETRVYAVVPDMGAIAGNTWVLLHGTDLPQLTEVRFGDTAATYVERLSPSTIAVRTPRAEDIGVVDVRVGDVTIPEAYTYFDPAAGFGGTWGSAIDGSVNVTVLQSGSEDPVEGAVVVLGAEDTPRFKGYTDERGQVTLSGPWLEGRQDVTAAKFGYSAASIIQFDAENATLALVGPSNPGGGGPPGEPLLPGRVEGSLSGVGKYLVMPPWPCDELMNPHDGLCDTCQTDADCGEGAPRCTSVTNQPRFCSKGCDADVDCLGPTEVPGGATPQSFVCRQAGAGGAGRCVPNPGRAEAWCFPTNPSIMSVRPQLTQDGRVLLDEEQHTFELKNVRLGEVAVYCMAGGVRRSDEIVTTGGVRAMYTPNDGTPGFGELVMHPTVMGVARHEFVLPGVPMAGPDEEQKPDQPTVITVPLDIPLGRELNVVIGKQPLRPEGPHETTVSAYLDLGSDGYIPMAVRALEASIQELSFGGLPTSLDGVLYDAQYVFYGAAMSNTDVVLPTSEVLRSKLGALSDGAWLHFDGAAWNKRKNGFPGDVNGVWARAADDVFGVTGDGAIIHYNGDQWSLQPVSGGPPLNAISSDGAGGLLAVGDAGRILRWDGAAWTSLDSGTDLELRGVTAIGADKAIAVGGYVILESDGDTWTPVPVGPPKELNAVWSSGASDVWAVGRHGAVLRRKASSGAWQVINVPIHEDLHGVFGTADGLVVAVGGGGLILMGSGDGTFEVIQSPTRQTLRAVWGRSAKDLYAVGDMATVLHYDGVSWQVLTEGKAELSLRAIDGAGTGGPGEMFALGIHAVHLGPFLTIPSFTSPPPVGLWDRRTVTWQAPAGAAEPTFNSLRLYGPTGGLVWNIMAPGWLTGFGLPDLDAIEGLPLVPSGQKTLMVYRVNHPQFDIDAHDSRVFRLLDWRAWVVARHVFDANSTGGNGGTAP